MTEQQMLSLRKRIAVRFVSAFLILVVSVFLPAWTLDYWQAYLYLALLMAPMVPVLLYFLKKDSQFLERRTHLIERDARQKVIMSLSTVIFFSALIVPGLDRRFGWSTVATAVVLVADGMDLIGYTIVFLVFRQNSYASRIIATEKEQKVISTGLYAIIRHPMYFGSLVMFVPAPLALGSYWGLIPAAIIPAVIVARIVAEESFLRKNLAGYVEYCQKVKYRLIPLVW